MRFSLDSFVRFEYEGSLEELRPLLALLQEQGFILQERSGANGQRRSSSDTLEGVYRPVRTTGETRPTVPPHNDMWKGVPGEEWPLPDTDLPTSDPKPDAPALRLPPQTSPHPEHVRIGCDVWYGLLSQWLINFDIEGDQPDRAKILMDTFCDSSIEMLAFLRYCGGLTRLVLTLQPDLPKKRIRHLAENIAQVSSALGLPGVSDSLEYSREYTRMGKGE